MNYDDGLTGNRVKRAGKVLRDWSTRPAGLPFVPEEVEAAVKVLMDYRKRFSAHRQPLASVNMSLRSMVWTATQTDVEVTQRLKRADRIIEKLVRFPQMQLNTMDDIGGCRVVVPSQNDLRKVQRYLERRWGKTIKRRRDYIADPNPTGYRAFHLVVIRHDMPIEVQLRTPGQQTWARMVEEAENRSGSMLKDGRGDAEVLEMFHLMGEAIASIDRGEPISPTVRRQIGRRSGSFRELFG